MISFEILNNEARSLIQKRLDEIKFDKKGVFDHLSHELKLHLKKNNLEAKIYGREKTPFSILILPIYKSFIFDGSNGSRAKYTKLVIPYSSVSGT